MLRKTSPAPGQRIDGGAGIPLVTVTTEVMSAQRIDEDEQHVQIVAFGQGLEILR